MNKPASPIGFKVVRQGTVVAPNGEHISDIRLIPNDINANRSIWNAIEREQSEESKKTPRK